MGLFNSKKELTSEQVTKLNSLLPKQFHQEKWIESDFKGDKRISNRLNEFYVKASDSINYLEKKLELFKGTELFKFNDDLEQLLASKIIIYNTELYEAKPIGMIDIGLVERFGSASTGNRFENGVLGYAIETASDNVWAENNAQESAVNKVKSQFLNKAKKIYPSCNMIFKYEVDFREIGSSGNVFIYMRGTACIGNNPRMVDAEKNNEKLRKERLIKESEILKNIQSNNDIKKFVNENISKIPKKLSDVDRLLS
jgi:hypothetical protein